VSFWKDYCYVDAHYEHPTTKRRMPWERLRVGQLDKIITKAHGANVFASVQRFKDAVPLRELAKEAEKKKAERKKAGGTDVEEGDRLARISEADEMPDGQLHYHGLYFDFDCDNEKFGITEEEAVTRSLGDVRTLLTWLMATFSDLRAPHIQAWYSGRKGFHLTVRPEVLGIVPHKHLSYIVKTVATEIKSDLDLKTLDISVYSIPRQWRIANTTHPKSGRFKIELHHAEVMNWPAKQIMEQARAPRGTSTEPIPSSHLHGELEYQDLAPDPATSTWWAERYAAYEAAQDLRNLRPKRPIVKPDVDGDFPVCVQDILNNGPKAGSNHPRNRVLLPMVGFFKDAGLDKQECVSQIQTWTEKFYPGPPGEMRHRHSNALSVIDNAYRPGSPNRFACRFIRSLSGPGDGGRVACVGEERCPWIGQPDDQDQETVPLVHLSQASRGCYIGTKVKTEIHVASVGRLPFEVPVKGRVLCSPDAEAKICKECPNRMGDGCGNGKMEFEISIEDRLLLELVNVPDPLKKAALKKKCGIPHNCFKHHFEPIEHGNLEELQVIPMVDHAQTFKIHETEEEALVAKSDKHVVRLAYFMGHGMDPNKKYRIEAAVWGHPKDQRVCFVFDNAEAAQDDIAQFRMTPDLHDKLKVFQVRTGQSVEQKLKEIHEDLTANVHRIGGRLPLSIAVDLCYHSVIGFRFLGDDIHKGWFELLVCGDSGTGKTTMIERMMAHFGLGEIVGGEDSKRTGLVYAAIQMQGQWVIRWGKIPQNDQRLLVIDEFSGIPKEELEKMTQLRSSGKAVGGGTVQDYETWARTRLIFLTNPAANHGRLAGFNFGIQAISDLFASAADLRRVDLAQVAERDDVDLGVLNKRWDQSEYSHIYTAHLCQSLVLWAWSRQPNQVKWMPGAEDEVLKWADRLGDTYDCDIPLAERSDLRLKIARIACAVAARLFSTDDEAKKVLVNKEHVEYAATFMDRSYRSDAMNYFQYARRWKQDNYFTQEKRDDITRTLKSFTNYDLIVSTLLDIDYFSKRQFGEMLDMDKGDLEKLWALFMKYRLVSTASGGRGYKKSVAFTRFLKQLGNTTSGYEETPKGPAAPVAEPHWSSRDDDDKTPEPLGEDPPF
jgi:hypothetical protein